MGFEIFGTKHLRGEQQVDTMASPLNSSEIAGLRQILEEHFGHDSHATAQDLARQMFQRLNKTDGRIEESILEDVYLRVARELIESGWRKGDPA
jgi:hypothetical protein